MQEPELTVAYIESLILSTTLEHVEGTSTVIAKLTSKGGYVFVGLSGTAIPEKFSYSLATKLATEKATKALWDAEAYRVMMNRKEGLYDG